MGEIGANLEAMISCPLEVVAVALPLLTATHADLVSAGAVSAGGSWLESLLAWTAAASALFASVLGFFTFRLRRDGFPLLLGIALLGSSLVEGVGVLAQLRSAAPGQAVRSWVASGPIEACLLGVAAVLSSGTIGTAQGCVRALALLAAVGPGLCWVLLQSGLGLEALRDLPALFLILLNGLWIYPDLRRKRSGPLATGLVLSVIPQSAAHLLVSGLTLLGTVGHGLAVAYLLRGFGFLVLGFGFLKEASRTFTELRTSLEKAQACVAALPPFTGAEGSNPILEWAHRVVHDVKNPLASITMAVDFLVAHLRERDSTTSEILDQIKAGIRKTVAIIDALGFPVKKGAEEERDG